jgi:Na+-translocating ferredoxin:NAD+ oxidoreductase RNF subunit RnfB
MDKIENILEFHFKNLNENEYKNLDKNTMRLLKEAFIVGYEQCIEDRKKIQGFYEIK